MPIAQRCMAEGFGTFCLVFAGTGSIVVDQLTGGQIGVVGIGMVFGLVVMAMISAVGPISGAHLNPAVTVCFFAARRHPGREILPYLFAQLAGAIIASLILRLLFPTPRTNLGMTLPSGSLVQSFILEFILTLILMAVILSAATGDREEGMPAGLAIGATIALEAIFAGPISGASMNPARSLGPAFIHHTFTAQWIYWLAPMAGSISGALILKRVKRVSF